MPRKPLDGVEHGDRLAVVGAKKCNRNKCAGGAPHEVARQRSACLGAALRRPPGRSGGRSQGRGAVKPLGPHAACE